MLLKFSTIAKNDHYSTQSVGKIDSIHCTSQFIINIGVVPRLSFAGHVGETHPRVKYLTRGEKERFGNC